VLLALAIVGLFVLPSPWNVIAVCAGALVEVGELWLWMRFLRRYRVRGGAEGMIGERARVMEACAPRGRVKVHGEIWAAIAPGEPVPVGATARVTGVDGLELTVVPEPGTGPSR
jgi:membrane-bound serine protease (ClpP class)